MLTVFVKVPPTANVTDAVFGETYAGLFRLTDDEDAPPTGMRIANDAVPDAFACEPDPLAGLAEGAGSGAELGVEPPPPPHPATAIAKIAGTAKCNRFISFLCLSRGLGW
jgi:hypothetical protein